LEELRISNEADKKLTRSSSSIELAKEITLKIKKNLAQTFKSKWTKERFLCQWFNLKAADDPI
jgi:hypothetical protein